MLPRLLTNRTPLLGTMGASRMLALALASSMFLSVPGIMGETLIGPRQAKAAKGVAGLSQHLLEDNKFGATCLDGSPPGYYLSRGWGTGKDGWIIYLQGGAWCTSLRECVLRAGTGLGSTTQWPDPKDPEFPIKIKQVMKRQQGFFKGIMSDDPEQNPAFYNYNKAFVFYCDGGGFAGNRTGVVYDSTTKLNFHGQRILRAVQFDLAGKHGARRAKNVLLTGCSAGGQAISMVCDTLGDLFPKAANVKCLMDAGFFLDGAAITGQLHFRRQAANLVALQNMRGGFDPDCTRGLPPRLLFKCFFPQYNLQYIKRPVFIVNSIVDYAAIYILNEGNGLEQTGADAVRCASEGKMSLYRKGTAIDKEEPVCTPQQTASINEYQKTIVNRINTIVEQKPGFESFVFDDLKHCTTIYPEWTEMQSRNKNLVPMVTDWFFA